MDFLICGPETGVLSRYMLDALAPVGVFRRVSGSWATLAPVAVLRHSGPRLLVLSPL